MYYVKAVFKVVQKRNEKDLDKKTKRIMPSMRIELISEDIYS